MKKLLISMTMLLSFGLFANAQTKTPAKATATVQTKKTGGTVAATTTTTTKTTAKKVTATPAKADGTPDMRYKANKTTVKTTGPLKKDGTPDMRYKKNAAAKP